MPEIRVYISSKQSFMKKIMLGILLVAGVQFTGFAQEAEQQPRQMRTPEERAQRQTEMLAQKLTLTEDQKKKIYDVNFKTAKQMQKFREAHDTANVRMIRTASDAAYQKILTPEQYKEYETMKQNRMEHRGEWRQRREGGDGAGREN